METPKYGFVHILAVLKNFKEVMIPRKFELLLNSWSGVVKWLSEEEYIWLIVAQAYYLPFY